MSRHDLVPKTFLLHLQTAIPGFAVARKAHQMAIAKMLWSGFTKFREHSHFLGHLTFTHKELDEIFGRRSFTTINSRLRLFNVTQWSADRGYTKGYAPTMISMQALETYLGGPFNAPTSFVYGDAKGIRTLKSPLKAVASRSMDGQTTTAWRNAKALGKVPVSIPALRNLRQLLTTFRDRWRQGEAPPAATFAQMPSLELMERLTATAGQIICLASTDVVGVGYVMHHYVQSRSGRLFAQGVSLQTAPTLIKQAALVGQWEYDISNCHFAILDQMAARCGYDCLGIRHYLANKERIRGVIAAKAGISVDEAKVCLLASLYGARSSLWHRGAITEMIGTEAAEDLYEVNEFKAVKDDIGGARRAVLRGWSRVVKGQLINDFGKAISKEASPEDRLAHLIQGIEAMALKTVIDLHPEDITLVQHDGWAARRSLDISQIQAAITRATGYRLEVEGGAVSIDLERYFSRVQNAERN